MAVGLRPTAQRIGVAVSSTIPYLGRFIQPDTLVPEPGNPQALNRYTYCLNNPVKYTDPSGFDPLDQEWQDAFYERHGREPGGEDVLIRLFSIAFTDDWDWSAFYDTEGNYVEGSLEKVLKLNRPRDWSWEDMPGALERLAAWYEPGEEDMYTRDIGSLFGGLPNRFESPNAWPAVSNANNPVRVWVYLSPSGLSPSLMGTSDRDANVHHWAWCLTMGGAYGGRGASVINTVREATQFDGDWYNTWSDIAIGNRGACMGIGLRFFGLSDVSGLFGAYMLG